MQPLPGTMRIDIDLESISPPVTGVAPAAPKKPVPPPPPAPAPVAAANRRSKVAEPVPTPPAKPAPSKTAAKTASKTTGPVPATVAPPPVLPAEPPAPPLAEKPLPPPPPQTTKPAVTLPPAKPAKAPDVDTVVLAGLAKRYGNTPVFENVALRVKPGEFVAIIGESGVGKSTLLNCMAGLDDWDAGSVTLAGHDLSTLDDTARALLRRAKVGFVFQAFHVLPHLDVAQNIALPLMLLHDAQSRTGDASGLEGTARSGMHFGEFTSRPSAAKRWLMALRRAWAEGRQGDWANDPRVAEVLEAVGLEGLGSRLPQQLSGGQLQRVAIARAVVHRPALILADEPTGNLDPDTAGKVMDVLSLQAREYGSAVVLVTHSQAAAARADRVCNLKVDGIFKRPPVYRKPKPETDPE